MTDAPLAVGPLTDPEIETVVASYIRQLPRFEDTARLVEQRLHRELRDNSVRGLLSSRAKEPDDLRDKLRGIILSSAPNQTFAVGNLMASH